MPRRLVPCVVFTPVTATSPAKIPRTTRLTTADRAGNTARALSDRSTDHDTLASSHEFRRRSMARAYGSTAAARLQGRGRPPPPDEGEGRTVLPMDRRAAMLVDRLGGDPGRVRLVRAPGRVNLVGDHRLQRRLLPADRHRPGLRRG